MNFVSFSVFLTVEHVDEKVSITELSNTCLVPGRRWRLEFQGRKVVVIFVLALELVLNVRQLMLHVPVDDSIEATGGSAVGRIGRI